MPHRIALLIFTCVLVLTGCRGGTGSNSNDAKGVQQGVSATKDDVEDLRGLITLTEDPEEVSWTESQLKPDQAEAAGKKDATRKLTAVLWFDGENARNFSARVTGLGKGEPVTITTESWYPAELVAQGQTGANETLRGTAYSAATFAKTYGDGRIVKIEGTDYYVLEMYAR